MSLERMLHAIVLTEAKLSEYHTKITLTTELCQLNLSLKYWTTADQAVLASMARLQHGI